MQNSGDLGRGFSSFPVILTIYSLCNHHTGQMRLVPLGSPFYWMRKQKCRKSGQMVCSESVVREAQRELGLGLLVYSRTALCRARRDSRYNPATLWGAPIPAEQWLGGETEVGGYSHSNVSRTSHQRCCSLLGQTVDRVGRESARGMDKDSIWGDSRVSIIIMRIWLSSMGQRSNLGPT